jgi:hypothetical protein
MIGGVQSKLLVTQDENGNLQLDSWQAELMGSLENNFNWKLIRERDGLTKQSEKVLWLEWNEDGTFKEKWDTPEVGRSLLMSPFNDFFTWRTTVINEIVEQREDYVKFKTKNSNYELFKIKK